MECDYFGLQYEDSHRLRVNLYGNIVTNSCVDIFSIMKLRHSRIAYFCGVRFSGFKKCKLAHRRLNVMIEELFVNILYPSALS